VRLHSLEVPAFKNLRKFSIDFNGAEATTVLLGRNGSGKSNLLEALVVIFRDLDLGRPPLFAYELAYSCREREIQVSADPDRRTSRVTIRVDGERVAMKAFSGRREELLPNNLFAYYSGPSNRLEGSFDVHQRQFYDALLRGDDAPLRRLFYARNIHSQFVLLSFFADPDPGMAEFLDEYFEIVGLESVLFVLRRPDWSRGRSGPDDGDARFWNARGTVQTFLDRLYALSLAPAYQTETVPSSYRSRVSEETLHLYLDGPEALRNLAGVYEGQSEFFKALESTYISDLIREVRIQVRKRDVDIPLTFSELSEGEQQLLTVLGLLKFTGTGEALFLLDEPDTHLNPRWSYDYLQLLDKVILRDASTHIVLATHDPVLIGGLNRDQVQVLDADRLTATSRAFKPTEDPKGMGVAGLLTSELFGLDSTVDPETQQMLDRSQELFAKEARSPADQEEMRTLSNDLADLGFSRTIRDPLYEKFVKAISATPEFQRPVTTPDERRAQDELALKAVREILDSEK
jgi:predicted ATPase